METRTPEPRIVEWEDWDFYFVDGSKVGITLNLDKGDRAEVGGNMIAITFRHEKTREITEGSIVVMANLLYYSKRLRKAPYVAPEDMPVAKELARLKAIEQKKLEEAGVITH